MTSLRGGRLWRFGLVAALMLLVVSTTLPALADPDLRDRLEENERKKQQLNERIEELQAQERDLLGHIRSIDEEVAEAEAVVNDLDSEIDKLNSRIGDLELKLRSAQADLAIASEELQEVLGRLSTRTDLFADRAVAAYKAGPAAYVESLLGAESFSDLTDRYEYHESALDADAQLVEEIKLLRAASEAKRDLIEERKNQIAANKLELERDKAVVAERLAEREVVLEKKESALAEKQAVLNLVETKKSRYQDAVAQLEADSSRIQSILNAQSSSVVSGPLPTGGGQLLWPTNGPMTSGYGYRTHPIFGDSRLHTGIDIGAGYGSPVIASDEGTVAYVGVMSGYGNVVVIDHGGGLGTTYNHLSSFSVGSGQSVSRGQVIGGVGCTGYCTGPHLHFEVRVGGSPVDPLPYLQ